MKESINYLNYKLNDNETIIVGCSGGPDSMCLLHMINHLNKNLKIICAHINHNIREESKEELEFVKDYCKKENIIFESITFEKKNEEKNYSEQELREKRYIYFEKIVHKYNANYLMTAHHGDDLIETILMRITRGSNLKGYSGFDIETNKDGYQLIKPLVFTTKSNIEEYNKINNIKYVTDKTNETDNYTRNRYRHNVLPFLKQENKNVHLKYIKFNKELNMYYDFVNKLVEQQIKLNYHNNEYNLNGFNDLDELLKIKIIEYILDDLYPDNLYLVSDKHVQLLLSIIKNNKANETLDLPNNIKITKQYNKLIINNINETKEFDIILENKLETKDFIFYLTEEDDDNSNYCIKLNSKEIELPLHIRNKHDGDKIKIKNLNGTKKVKDIYINEKIPLSKRNNLPIIVDNNNEVLWLPGIKKSQFDKANKENYDIIIKYKTKERYNEKN